MVWKASSTIASSLSEAALKQRKIKFLFNDIFEINTKKKHAKNIFPSRLDFLRLAVDHLCYTAHYHVTYGWRTITLHDVLKRSKKILLETVIGELSFFYELHGKLSKRVDREEGDVLITASPNFVEMVAQYFPDARPLQTNSSHVIVRNLNNFLQTEHPRLSWMSQFLK